MATYTVAAGAFGAYEKVATANTVDTVTFGQVVPTVEVVNHSTTSHVYVRLDGTDPAAANASTILVPAGTFRTITVRGADPDSGNTEVRVISTGTPTYSVARAV